MSVAVTAAACFSHFRAPESVSGYATPASVAPGERVSFRVSSRVGYQISIVKLSAMAEGSSSGLAIATLVARTGGVQRTTQRAWQAGCGWDVTDEFDVPVGTDSGIYAARCACSDGSVTFISFVVRPGLAQQPILVIANTNTWNAYNEWGGQSRYGRSVAGRGGAPGSSRAIDRETFSTSFSRPNSVASPIGESAYDSHLLRAELWLHRWLEAQTVGGTRRYLFDVCTDDDFHYGRVDASAYRAIVLNTHPEYWTREMVARLRSCLSSGVNVLYLGGNGLFEAVKYDAAGQSLVFHDGDTTLGLMRFPYLFRNLNGQVCEREFLGVAFLHDNYEAPLSPYSVQDASHWLFRDPDAVVAPGSPIPSFVSNGTLIGSGGYKSIVVGGVTIPGGACGREMDTSINGNVTGPGIVTAYVGSDRGAHPTTPSFTVLARGTNGLSPSMHTGEIVSYDTAAGGFVLSVGSFCFTSVLHTDVSVQKLIRNALDGALYGH